MDTATAFTWVGILLCIAQSGTLSGLNLSLFGISALRLESLAALGNDDAVRLLELRRDSNCLLATVLWANVGLNVLLTLLTDSVLAGASAFVFSTVIITFGGEIIPQAYFTRNALRMATLMRPFLRFWQVVLFPVAKPTGLLLDFWLGGESVDFLSERELRETAKLSIVSPHSEMSRVEGIGVLNFLALDDLAVCEEGEPLDPATVIELPEEAGAPVFPHFEPSPSDPFLRRIGATPHKWVVFTSPDGRPLRALDAHSFLRATLLGDEPPPIESFCHRPIVVYDDTTRLEQVLPAFHVHREHEGDDVVDHDVVLVWSGERRIITGSDLFGRLLRGIARPVPAHV